MSDNDLTPAAALQTLVFSRPAPPTPGPTPPAPAPSPTSPADPASAPTMELSPSEAATMIGWIKADLLAGKITPEAATKAFDQLGASPEQRLSDSRSDEQKLLDAQFPAAKPEDFVIQWEQPGVTTPMSPEVTKARDAQARNWLVAMGFDRENGQAVINILSKLEQRKLTPEQVEAHVIAENAKLETLYGDQFDDRLGPAARMIHEVEATHPGLKEFLRENGVGDTALIVNALANQSRIYWAKRNAQQGR